MLTPVATEEIELPQDKLFRQLSDVLSDYLDQEQIAEVRRSYQLANQAHEGQFRLTGEPYICHPLSVAMILAEMRMDARGIMAAIMHDVIEDTPVTKDQLRDTFGDEVADLVDGVTKLGRLDSKSRAEAQARNVRKMFLAMVKDLRVIMVKLADRLHNMRTLDTMSGPKRHRIASETLDIYAPIANRLGMHEMRLELEDLGFSAMYPMRSRVLDQSVRKARGNRREVISSIEATIKKRLADAGMPGCEVMGREKHLYSLYQKMRNKRRPFAEVYDVYAFRVICENVDECYRALGIAHSLYKPMPGRFKDYVAVPKANGYQSLHTVLAGPYGQPLEIQIRTRAMHHLAESGIAAHWLYKSEKSEPGQSPYSQARAHEWLQDLLEIQKSAGDSMEFLDNLKVDLFQREAYVFTPKGQIVKLPRGATVVDFAYAVHTHIGNTCVSARIDRQLAPLQTILQNGQTVEVITAPWARPNPLWLNFVVTAKARAAIRSHLRNFKSQEGIALGQRLLEKELDGLGHRYEQIPQTLFDDLLKRLDLSNLDALLEDIGFGNRLPMLVARQLVDMMTGENTSDHGASGLQPLIIRGTEGMVVNLAKCCRPIPGDPIIGLFNPGKGIVVHLTECKNLEELRKRHINWLDVQWDKQASGEFPAVIKLELMNEVGTLAKVASTISRMRANIENVQMLNQDSQLSVDYITLLVRDRNHLANVVRELRKLSIVLKISRVKSELRKKPPHG
jgi:GTP pyrophosphokinase/guanosine-3',5'-bis(diphosphate) 3'-pyrophosphohydrolase